MAELDPAPVADPIDPVAADPAPQADPTPARPSVDPVPAADPTPVDPVPADDWRSRMAGDDAKLLSFLGRYQSEKAFVEAAKKDREAARSKTITKLPDNPTPEEIAAYRKENGIPETMDGYLEGLPNGIVVGEEDRPNVDKFLEKMHGVNADKKTVAASLEAYYGLVAEQQADQAEQDRSFDQECVDALNKEWGTDYRRNSNVLKAYVDGMPGSVAEAFKEGRGPDGRPLSMNPDMMRWLTGKALEENPLATVVPGAGANQASAVADEIASIEKMMRTDRVSYNKDEKVQARYRELLTAREKMKGN